MATVIGIRHGRVENPGNLVYARLPGFRLSADGEKATHELGDRLAPFAVAAVYSSPLERAQQTARLLAEPHELEIVTDERLIEWSFWSRWEGTPWDQVRERAPEVFAHYADDPERLHPREPLSRAGADVVAWARDAAERHGGLVIGVSHEAPLAAASLVAQGLDLKGFAGVQVDHLAGVRLHPAPTAVGDPAELARA